MKLGTAAEMSVRSVLLAIVLTAVVSVSALIPDGPDKVRWTALLWLSIYASAMLAQATWLGWRWLARWTSSSSR